MAISARTQGLVERRWKAFCRAVVQAQEEHGEALVAYFGESQVVCDQGRLEEHHTSGGDYSSGDYEDGGAVLIYLPRVTGFRQDGGGW